MADAEDNHRPDEPTVAELVHNLSQQTSQLVREELRLAQAELLDKGRHAGMGLGLFSGAGLLAFFGAAGLITTAILALTLVLPGWVAALIVTAALFAASGVAAMVGRSQVRQATPAKPEQAMENVPQDVRAVRRPAKERNR